jgi:hypothetical protein
LTRKSSFESDASCAQYRVLVSSASERLESRAAAAVRLAAAEKEKSPTADPTALENVAQNAMVAGD